MGVGMTDGCRSVRHRTGVGVQFHSVGVQSTASSLSLCVKLGDMEALAKRPVDDVTVTDADQFSAEEDLEWEDIEEDAPWAIEEEDGPASEDGPAACWPSAPTLASDRQEWSVSEQDICDGTEILPPALLNDDAVFRLERGQDDEQEDLEDSIDSDVTEAAFEVSEADNDATFAVSDPVPALPSAVADAVAVDGKPASATCPLLVYSEGVTRACGQPIAERRYAGLLRGVWETSADCLAPRNADESRSGLDRIGICSMHYMVERNAASTPTPKTKSFISRTHCRGCSKLYTVIAPECDGFDDISWMKLGDSFLRIPLVASKCLLMSAATTPPPSQRVRDRAGYFCQACLSRLGVHLSAVTKGQGSRHRCDHVKDDIPAMIRSMEDLVKEATCVPSQARMTESVGIGQARKKSPYDVAFASGKELMKNISRWWMAKTPAERAAFKKTSHPAAVNETFPPYLQGFLAGVRTCEATRALEASRKAESRGASAASLLKLEQRRATRSAGRSAFLGSLLCMAAIPSSQPGVLENLTRMHRKRMWSNEEGEIMRCFGIHTRHPERERLHESLRLEKPQPLPRVSPASTVVFAADNLDISNAGPSKADAYNTKTQDVHITAAIAIVYPGAGEELPCSGKIASRRDVAILTESPSVTARAPAVTSALEADQQAFADLPAVGSVEGIDWLVPKGPLLEFEQAMATVAARIAVDTECDLGELRAAVARMCDRSSNDLLAAIHIVPPSEQPATSNKGISDILTTCSMVKNPDTEAIVVGDQAVYARLLKVIASEPASSWAAPYPGMPCPIAVWS